MNKPKKVVTGQYNRLVYEVFLDGQQVCSCGNAHGDSTLVVPANEGIGLKTLRRFCAKTTREIANESKARYGGIERVADSLSDAEFGRAND